MFEKLENVTKMCVCALCVLCVAAAAIKSDMQPKAATCTMPIRIDPKGSTIRLEQMFENHYV